MGPRHEAESRCAGDLWGAALARRRSVRRGRAHRTRGPSARPSTTDALAPAFSTEKLVLPRHFGQKRGMKNWSERIAGPERILEAAKNHKKFIIHTPGELCEEIQVLWSRSSITGPGSRRIGNHPVGQAFHGPTSPLHQIQRNDGPKPRGTGVYDQKQKKRVRAVVARAGATLTSRVGQE